MAPGAGSYYCRKVECKEELLEVFESLDVFWQNFCSNSIQLCWVSEIWSAPFEFLDWTISCTFKLRFWGSLAEWEENAPGRDDLCPKSHFFFPNQYLKRSEADWKKFFLLTGWGWCESWMDPRGILQWTWSGCGRLGQGVVDMKQHEKHTLLWRMRKPIQPVGLMRNLDILRNQSRLSEGFFRTRLSMVSQDGEVEWMLVSDNKPVLSHACCETGGVCPGCSRATNQTLVDTWSPQWISLCSGLTN